ncbi:hypothetical protein F5Y04DRAFT_214113 [Hypomontagnella monticulosa]|nr:hypothetical protein F5Y04DRAFT_214113 [Hypomontagnella monticulosa]
MHFPSSTVAALPSTLLTLLLLPGSSVATGQQAAPGVAERSACIRNSATSLSAAAACGDKGALENCFRHAPQYVEAGDLERCFVDAGCTQTEAGIEASFVLHNCDAGKSAAELRRRGPEPIPVPTPEPAPAPAPQAATTSPAANGGFTPSIQCSTETTISTSSCPIQSTGSESGKSLPCFQTTVPTQVCAAENICMKDRNGVDICMRRSDTLDTGGIVVTIFLAVVFAASFATLIILCCRDKRAERKRRARKEAAAIAKTNAANATSATMAGVGGGNDDAAFAKREQSPAAGPGAPAPGAGGAPGQNPFADGPRY